MHGLSGGRWPASGKPDAPPPTRRALVVSAAEKMRSQGALKALDGVSATLNLSEFCICGENF